MGKKDFTSNKVDKGVGKINYVNFLVLVNGQIKMKEIF